MSQIPNVGIVLGIDVDLSCLSTGHRFLLEPPVTLSQRREKPMPSRRERIEQAMTDLSGLQHLYPTYYATLKAMSAEENERKDNERPNRRRTARHARNRPAAS